MGLEKAIKNGKEHRKEYHGAKKIASSCRNHGNCPWCKGNRTYQRKKLEEKIKSEMNEKIE